MVFWKNKREKNKLKMERDITADSTEIQRPIRHYDEQLYKNEQPTRNGSIPRSIQPIKSKS